MDSSIDHSWTQRNVALFFVVLTVVVVSSALFSCMVRAISVNYSNKDSTRNVTEQDLMEEPYSDKEVMIWAKSCKETYFSEQIKWKQDILY